jgi:putative nucleotidyltransferase with HDIG domain
VLAWPAAAAAEVARSVPADRSLPLAAGVLAALLGVAAVAVVRLLRRPAARAPGNGRMPEARRPPLPDPLDHPTPSVPPPDVASAEAEATLARLADLLTRTAERGAAAPVDGLRVVAAAHARDRQTLAHSVRVARYAVALARRLAVGDDLVAAVEWGALLHDVGKIAVPAEILHKAGPLTAAEEAVMRRHPRHGYRLLRDLVFLGPALDVVLSHHERWDGAGYPNRLARERIPLAARIFAVADTYDAITSDRPYRPARGHAEAVAELARVAGTQLDPRLVAAFLALPEAQLTALRDEAAPEWRELERLGRGRRRVAGAGTA